MDNKSSQNQSNNKITFLAILAVSSGFFFYFYEYILRISPSVMEDELMAKFQVGAAAFGAMSVWYYYAYTPMQLIVGTIVDKIKIKYVLSIAALLCGFGTFFISMSDSFALACTGRFLQGLGSAFAWVGIMKLASMFLPDKYFGAVSGYGSALGFLGAAAGQMTIGHVVATVGWYEVLHILAIAGIPLAIIIFTLITVGSKGRNTQEVNATAESSVIKDFFTVLKNPYIWIAGIIAELMFLPTTVFAELWGVSYFRTVYNFSIEQASNVSSMIFFGWAIGSIIVGSLSIKVRTSILLRVGSFISIFVALMMLYLPMNYYALCAACIAFGAFSSIEVLTFAMGMSVVENRLAGTAVALVNFLCMSSGMLFQGLPGKFLELAWDGAKNAEGTPIYSVSDYKQAVTIIPIALVLCFIITLFVDDKNKRIKLFSKK
ncbi:MAG: MFS transporter [Neisseriaceae bacterium]|jgi:sugar phosphate permease|nr:MAG: MFS transporter [Neisseriaceae bacterium]